MLAKPVAGQELPDQCSLQGHALRMAARASALLGLAGQVGLLGGPPGQRNLASSIPANIGAPVLKTAACGVP